MYKLLMRALMLFGLVVSLNKSQPVYGVENAGEKTEIRNHHAQTVVVYETTTEVLKKIPHEVKYEFNRQLRRGSLKVASEGKDGAVVKKFLIAKRNGKVVSKAVLGTERQEPVHKVIHMGPGGFQASRHGFSRKSARPVGLKGHKILTMKATAYSNSPRENGGYRTTKTGMALIDGVIAVDPRVIPLRSVVYIEGPYGGFYSAQDTGRAIKGNKIDICIPNRRDALKFGRRNLKVHILKFD